MYVITSKINGTRVGLAQDEHGGWYWTEQLIDAYFFKHKSEARRTWITHRDFLPKTKKKVYIDELVLEQIETLE